LRLCALQSRKKRGRFGRLGCGGEYRELNRPGPYIIRQGANGCSHHDASAGQRFAKAIVERTDFSALGAQDRLVLVLGFDLRITGGTAVVAEAVPFIPPIPYRRDRCGVSETTASVSSSFGSGREGIGDFGIVFFPGGERFGKLGR
jgi:hypothetical protein